MDDQDVGWPRAAAPAGKILLRLADGEGEDPKHNLSAGTRVGNSLFVAGDEMAVLEVLTLDAAGGFSSHERYQLADLVDLREPDEEVDIEGISAESGWL